uniref:Uncharacterized protein n=1 Tax=Podoviridae sp. ct8Lf7 TaxID=2827723 RepID=A0A8S5S0C4_9CAUD|nr:MAG TPA: hypothetical protein [Podoviridae sp. ct8Lf7]
MKQLCYRISSLSYASIYYYMVQTISFARFIFSRILL